MVAKKAAITTKAANVAFSASAEEMSEMLTAVWNSYQVGEAELEKYVDIMAALGAATATSTEEIATAMQKVAATANTVGVSMEQMSSIIATVASVTREAPESIGTSFKTILARMGDLKVGKTLEDGMSLGTVSSQLAAVGVNILDTTGELKEMGGVIEELMGKWQGMTSAEKTAVAQAVAGKRQYTQLMALMENQDMYKKSMNIAGGAEGTLQK
ncbi:MAG: phage tail tape measure protein [Erysipelotrichia bacterium]|nr:phage tail tape measure protein [Erysipelotrichia bacterium]